MQTSEGDARKLENDFRVQLAYAEGYYLGLWRRRRACGDIHSSTRVATDVGMDIVTEPILCQCCARLVLLPKKVTEESEQVMFAHFL